MSENRKQKTEGGRQKAESRGYEAKHERSEGKGAQELENASQSASPPMGTPRGRHSPFAISCPFCGSEDVELSSLFGSQLLTTEYYCRGCRTVFEQVKR